MQSKEILYKYASGTITASEIATFNEWLHQLSEREYAEVLSLQTDIIAAAEITEKPDAALLHDIQQRRLAYINKQQKVHRLTFIRWAAAILILAIGAGIYYFNIQSNKITGGTRRTGETRVDIMPGGNRAILTINNDQKIDLETNKTGININNTVTYNDGEKIADAGQMLQLTTPRGGQYQAVLPDGSKVWLNAASSIKFPSKFNSIERRVEVTGEVYFEISKDATKPFKVSGGGQEIEVLGTSFNINVYNDEPIKKTTLITGSIKITYNNQTAILQPGQQANISIIPITQIKQITVQTNDIIAWKSGLFNLENATIEEIMRPLSRWYNFNISYEGIIKDRFRINAPRSASINEILEMLELTKKLLFTIQGNTIIVRPA